MVRHVRESTAAQRQPFRRARPQTAEATARNVSVAAIPVGNINGGTTSVDSTDSNIALARAVVVDRASAGAECKQSTKHKRAREPEVAKRRRKNREELLEEEQLASWLSTRELVPSKGASADERMQRIRDKIARERSR